MLMTAFLITICMFELDDVDHQCGSRPHSREQMIIIDGLVSILAVVNEQMIIIEGWVAIFAIVNEG